MRIVLNIIEMGTVDKMGSFRIIFTPNLFSNAVRILQNVAALSHDILASKANKPSLGMFKAIRVRPIETATYISGWGSNPIGGEISR